MWSLGRYVTRHKRQLGRLCYNSSALFTLQQTQACSSLFLALLPFVVLLVHLSTRDVAPLLPFWTAQGMVSHATTKWLKALKLLNQIFDVGDEQQRQVLCGSACLLPNF